MNDNSRTLSTKTVKVVDESEMNQHSSVLGSESTLNREKQ